MPMTVVSSAAGWPSCVPPVTPTPALLLAFGATQSSEQLPVLAGMGHMPCQQGLRPLCPRRLSDFQGAVRGFGPFGIWRASGT